MTKDVLNEHSQELEYSLKDRDETPEIVSIKENHCDYFYSFKGNYGVIAFSGILKSNASKVFDRASVEILDSECTYVIISLDGVDAMDFHGIRCIATLQKSIREDGRYLRICGADRLIREKLLSSGAVREEEFKDNIATAIKGFIKNKRVKKMRSRKK